jgi:hypothetical protein
MDRNESGKSAQVSVLDVMALLAGRSVDGFVRGQVGTVVDILDDDRVLVEFSDEQGRAYAVSPCERLDLLILHYVPNAA